MERIDAFYVSLSDYILESIFDAPTTLTPSGKLEADASKALERPHRCVLAPNKYPYMLPDGTQHSVLWYLLPADAPRPSDDEITKDIAEALPCGGEFVWYPNPKM